MPNSRTDGPEQNRDLIREVYAIGDSGDLSRLQSVMADDYVLTQADGHPVPGTWKGESATEAAARVFARCGTTGITVHEIIADGPNRVIALVDAHGIGPNGQPWTMPVAECFWVENGKVTEIRPFYWDLVTLRKTVGVAG
jgi:ketosteroid isomerase-like protein